MHFNSDTNYFLKVMSNGRTAVTSIESIKYISQIHKKCLYLQVLYLDVVLKSQLRYIRKPAVGHRSNKKNIYNSIINIAINSAIINNNRIVSNSKKKNTEF